MAQTCQVSETIDYSSKLNIATNCTLLPLSIANLLLKRIFDLCTKIFRIDLVLES